jgi:cytochrome c oxidase subunit 2
MIHWAMMALAWVPGFAGNQTPLNPVGPGAAHIEQTLALIFWITLSVYCVVMIVFVTAIWRRHHSLDTIPEPQPTSEASDRRAGRAVIGAIGVTIVLLFIMMISSFRASRALGSMNNEQALTIQVIGHQWWWEVQYPNKDASKTVITANEIHIPVGVPIRIHGTSRDVIHSFWLPNVQGKRDLLPGYQNDLMLQIDRPGRYQGQCAEYCGEQHAHMSFEVVAEPETDFDYWLSLQMKSAVSPPTPDAARGQQVFLTRACVMCHTIRGTTAGSRVGPDLTHLASRSTIAAGMLPNTIGNLAGWILNAQNLKPGCRMPPNQMSGTELQDLLAYLETLQ